MEEGLSSTATRVFFIHSAPRSFPESAMAETRLPTPRYRIGVRVYEYGFPRRTPLKRSEKSRTPLQRSLTGHRNGTFRAVLAFVYWPNLRSKPRSDPFSDSFRGGVLGN